MKNGKAIFLSAAVMLGAAGMIFGNHVLASGALAARDTHEPAIVMPEAAPVGMSVLSKVGMYRNSDDAAYLALTSVAPDIEEPPSHENGNPTDGNLTEDDAKQIGINAIAEEYGLTQKDIDNFDVTVRGAYAADWPSTVPNRIVWKITLYPPDAKSMTYSAIVDDDMQKDTLVHGAILNSEGTPLANELSSDKAQEIAIAAIVKKYALTQETLDKFTVTTKYFEVTEEAPDKHTWWVNLYPTNTDEFSEIGCYWTYIDAETGDVLQLNSAADGKG